MMSDETTMRAEKSSMNPGISTATTQMAGGTIGIHQRIGLPLKSRIALHNRPMPAMRKVTPKWK